MYNTVSAVWRNDYFFQIVLGADVNIFDPLMNLPPKITLETLKKHGA